jgi:hypothetical protein
LQIIEIIYNLFAAYQRFLTSTTTATVELEVRRVKASGSFAFCSINI